MFANIDGVQIHYEIAGDGPAIVFMHGLGGTCNVWHAQRIGLQKYFKVVAFDLPGSGRSDKSASAYSMEKWVEQLAALADALGLERFVLAGHSMTTVVAQKFAAAHGSRLVALVLCGPLVELAQAGKEAFGKRAETVLREGMTGVADHVLGGALTAAAREGAQAALAGLYREMLLSNDPKCYAGHCQALIAGSARADQARIECPTLILVGDQDGVTPLSLCRSVAVAIRNCRIRVIPRTAHLTMLESPAEFNAALIEFLATV